MTTQGEARVVMVNSGMILTNGFISYQTNVDDPMMEENGVYKSSGNQAYKNSKVHRIYTNNFLFKMFHINIAAPYIVKECKNTRMFYIFAFFASC